MICTRTGGGGNATVRFVLRRVQSAVFSGMKSTAHGLVAKARRAREMGGVESARGSTAGVYVEYAGFFVLSGLMGMAEEDNVNTGGGRGEVEIVDVMDKVEGGRSGFDEFGLL